MSPVTTPDVSVVLCTRDGAARLGPTLAHLAAAMDAAMDAAMGLTCEAVLVDNGSRDATPALLADAARRDPRLRPVHEPTPGLGRARNRGIAAATGQVVLFTDDDVHVPPHWITRMAAPLLHGEADLVGGAVLLAGHLHRPWLTPSIAAADDAVVPEPPVVGREFAGASMGATRAVLDAVPFDESLGTARYPGADGTAFRLDVLTAGFRQTAVAGASVEHHPDPGRLDPRRLPARAAGRGRGEAYLAYHLHGRHPSALTEVARLAATSGRLLLRRMTHRPPVDAEALRLHCQVAFHRELLALRRAHARRERDRRAQARDGRGGLRPRTG